MNTFNFEHFIREVTDEEVAFYQEYGWVMMKGLVDPLFVSKLLDLGKEWKERLESDYDKSNPSRGLALDENAGPFHHFMFSKRMVQCLQATKTH